MSLSFQQIIRQFSNEVRALEDGVIKDIKGQQFVIGAMLLRLKKIEDFLAATYPEANIKTGAEAQTTETVAVEDDK